MWKDSGNDGLLICFFDIQVMTVAIYFELHDNGGATLAQSINTTICLQFWVKCMPCAEHETL